MIKLLDEGRISKFAVGVVEIDLAQRAVANIKDGQGIPKTWAEFKPLADRARAIQDKLNGAFVLWVGRQESIAKCARTTCTGKLRNTFRFSLIDR